MDVTPKKQKANLAKLADYLDRLPSDYSHFRMADFAAVYLGGEGTYAPPIRVGKFTPSKLNVCGTAACAVGHGPSAGIRIYKDASWFDYCERVFGVADDSMAFYNMFGPDNPDDPKAAAERIRAYLVEQGA